MHPQDMADAGIEVGDLVRVTSKRGQLVLPANASHELARRQCFIGMHWGSEYLGGRSPDGQPMAGVNGLTTSAYCPTSKQPELKHAAVRIEKTALPWTLQAMAWLPAEKALEVQQALRPLLNSFDYAACVPFAAAGGSATAGVPTLCGIWFQAACAQPPDDHGDWLRTLTQALDLNTEDTLSYADPLRHQHRRVRVGGAETSRVQAFLLAGDSRSSTWLSTLLRDTLPTPVTGLALLQARDTAPGGATTERSQPICNCLGITAQAIRQTLPGIDGDPAERLATLQSRLGCGTQCGSCVPELKRLVQQNPVAVRIST